MSRRGAGSALRRQSQFDLKPAPSFARRIVSLAREMLAEGLDAGEVCSLFTDAAQVLSKQRGGLSRQDWLELCAELYDRGESGRGGEGEGEGGANRGGPRLTAPGGEA